MLGQAKCSNKRTTAELTNTQYGGTRGKAQGTQRWLLFLFPWRLDPPRAPAQHRSSPPLDYSLALTPLFLSLVFICLDFHNTHQKDKQSTQKCCCFSVPNKTEGRTPNAAIFLVKTVTSAGYQWLSFSSCKCTFSKFFISKILTSYTRDK